MSLLKDTKAVQSQMAMYCRTGENLNLPGVTPGRFENYRRLILNIVQEHLEASFPIACSYVDPNTWAEMTLRFFAEHSCQSYQVWKIAGEFYHFAVANKFGEEFGIGFLTDLLKFEWEELRLYNMQDSLYPSFKRDGDLKNSAIVVNPEFSLLQLQYPVHVHNPYDALTKPGAYFLLLFRERESGRIQFLEVSAWHAFLVEQFAAREISLLELVKEASPYFAPVSAGELKKYGIQFLQHLKKCDFILGFK